MELKPGYKQTEIGVIPEDWEVKSVHEVAAIKTGPFGTLLKAAEYAGSDGVPLVSVGEIREGFLKITDQTPRVPEIVVRRLPQYVLRTGDIVFGRKGAVERSVLIRQHQHGFFLGSDGISIRPSKQCHNEYLAVQFQSHRVKGWLIQNAIGTTMPSLNQEILRKVAFPLPPTKAEQEAIAEALSDADALIESLEQLIAKKRHLKQGAMQALLSSKKRLPGFSEEWNVKRLGEVAEIVMGQSPSGRSYNKNGYGSPLINGPTEFTDLHPIKIQWTSAPTKFCRPNDLLLCVRGSSTGRMNISDDVYCIGRGVAAIRGKIAVDTSFITFQVHSAIQTVLALTTGSTFPNIDGKAIRSTAISLPRLSEQSAIATILSDMDAEIAGLEAKLAKARQIKQGMMHNLLTGKIRLV